MLANCQPITDVFGDSVHGGGCYYDPSQTSAGQVFLNEAFSALTFVFLCFGVGIEPKQGRIFGAKMAPLLAGGALGLITFSTSGILPGYAGGQMNPARCFGFGIARRDMSDQWIWWLADAAAGLLMALLFNFAPLQPDIVDASGRRPVKPPRRRNVV